MKIQLIYVTLWSLTQAAYISRIATMNRLRGPTPMRPGVMLGRPWTPPRLVQAASHRSPYVIYRNSPHRYAVKHINPSITRSIFTPWKSARLPQLNAVTPEYEFVRTASSTPVVHTDGTGLHRWFSNGSIFTPWKSSGRLPPPSVATPEYEFVHVASSTPVIHTDGAIHTIPAPNLSFSEKPIVVIDSSENSQNPNTATEATKPVYEVTEKYPEPPAYEMSAKIEPPIGFSKPNPFNMAELHNIQNVRNNVALQLTSEYGIPITAIPQQSMAPQQFSLQGFNRMPTHQDLLQTGSEGIIIPPHALYQPDPMFLQKLQAQLLQQYPAVEFIPYATPEFQHQPQPQTPEQSDIFLLENEQFIKRSPSSFAVNNPENKNVVQRETQEGTVLSLLPQEFTINNVTEKSNNTTTTTQPNNVTIESVTSEVSQTPTTTISQVVDNIAAEQKTSPIYYAQIGQSVGSVIADGFYSAINDVRAAAAMAQDEKPPEIPKPQPFNTTSTSTTTTTTTTTLQPDLQPYFVQNTDKNNKNQTLGDLKPLLGVPFEKPAESVNVAYTLLRADKDNQATTKDGVVYAGQLVEATISEDQDFNKEKANIFSKRPPLRLFAIPEKRTTETPQKVTMVKAKIPPKSKLTFDDKTGEPVLRIYASYLDSPLQKERLTTKLANMKYINEAVTKKQDNLAPVKSLDKTQGSDKNQVTQFGLKVRSRSDDYIPLFEDYEE